MLAPTAASGDVCQMWLKTVVMNFGSWSSACLRDAYADSALGDVRESVCDEFWSWSSVHLYDSCADSASGDVCLMWIRTTAVNFGDGALYVCVMPVLTVLMWIRTTAVNFGDGALYVCVMPVLTVFRCLCDACADSI